MGENLHLYNLVYGDDFLDPPPKARSMKENLISCTWLKLKTSALQKTMLREREDRPQTGRNYDIWEIYISTNWEIYDKGLLSKIYKELLKIIRQLLNLKHGQLPWTDISPRKIYRWKISVWKDVQHHTSSGNCKLKQQWDTTTHY